MEVHAIPAQDKYIIYRPLRRLAFVGNRAMADLAFRFAELPPGSWPEGHPEALTFLETIGFTQPDPPGLPAPAEDAAFRPVSVALLMTGRCNLRCIYCYASGGEKDNLDMPIEIAAAAIDQVCRNAIEMGQPSFEVTFHGGGEPSLAWETVKSAAIRARACDLPAKLNMVSNGVWDRARSDWVIANLDGLTISMDGSQVTQDAQRPFPNGHGSFDAVMRTLHYLDQAKFTYNIRVTATPERFERLPEDIAFFCKETGCRTIQVEPAFHSERGAHHAPTQGQAIAFGDAFLAGYDVARAAGRFMYYSGARPWLLTNAFCSAPMGSALTINPRGEIVACYEITGQDHPLAGKSTFGRLDPLTGKVEIDRELRQTFLSDLQRRQDACRGCFCYWHCAGDCYTRAFENPAGGSQQPYARCSVNQAVTAGLLLRSIAAGDGVYQGELPSTSKHKFQVYNE